MTQIGFMQGRLSPIEEGKIQAFPWSHWQSEFKIAHDLGFELMEWTLDQERLEENPLMTRSGRQQISQLCNEYGISIRSLTGDCFMQAPFWKSEGSQRKLLLEQIAEVLMAAASLEISYVVVPLVDNGSLENQQQIDSLDRGLETIRPILRDGNLKLVFESDFSPAKLLELIANWDNKYFGINYDIGNSAALGYDPALEIATYGSYIGNVHVKDRLLGGTTVPLGTGNANLPLVFKLLQEANYQGQYILQTARAVDRDHAGVLCRYRDLVKQLIANAE
ncbi:MAG: sugar phosphate isomerase/epimerase family protein [Pleurocapsa sp. MO_226.B13]|nr:sugar phosphate isomerase/epimerase family protein [Pleurocapsa sp. MO_226.B13]